MDNYRQRMAAAGCPEVLVNKRKRGQETPKAVKKSKKGGDPFLARATCTTATFSHRRQQIIGDEPLISTVMERWPALFTERQVNICFLFNIFF